MVGKLFRVVFSKKARERTKEISDYYTRTASTEVAKKVRSNIKEEARKLEKLPSSKPLLPEAENLDAEIRYTKVWSFKIIFQVLNPVNIVRILTIKHDRENPQDVKEDL